MPRERQKFSMSVDESMTALTCIYIQNLREQFVFISIAFFALIVLNAPIAEFDSVLPTPLSVFGLTQMYHSLSHIESAEPSVGCF